MPNFDSLASVCGLDSGILFIWDCSKCGMQVEKFQRGMRDIEDNISHRQEVDDMMLIESTLSSFLPYFFYIPFHYCSLGF